MATASGNRRERTMHGVNAHIHRSTGNRIVDSRETSGDLDAIDELSGWTLTGRAAPDLRP